MATDKTPKITGNVNGNSNPRDLVSLSTKVIELLRRGKSGEIHHLLKETLQEEEKQSLGLTFKDGETVLHVAVKMRANQDVISALIDTCPELLCASRQESELYRGQTALHMAITGCDLETVELILNKTKSYNVLTLNHLMKICATGMRFDNTVMLGEIPISVAALTLNTEMFEKVMEYQQNIDAVNSRGDNVCHCLIRYAHLYPEKLEDVMQMLKFIANWNSGEKPSANNLMKTMSTLKLDIDEHDAHNVHIWMMKNVEGLNPLQLSAQVGQQPIFKMITEMKRVYCYVNSEDGLFDVELYDVSDIDVLYDNLEPNRNSIQSHNKLKGRPAQRPKSKPNNVPTMEMIFNSDPNVVFKFIQMSPLRYVINRKWLFYRWFYTLWGFLHVLFMIGFTIYSVRRSSIGLEMSQNGTSFIRTITHEIPQDVFVTFYIFLSFVVAMVLFIQEVVRIVKGRMPWTWAHLMNCYHNGPFRLMLLAFAIVVLVDIVWYLIDPHHGNFFMVIAMILGWWFLVFFLRGFRQFSFFTVMIQKIIVGDMFRFSIIIGMELVAFTTALYIVFQGTQSSDETVSDYTKLTVHMFKMMFGFTTLDVLFEARHPWFAVGMYTAFVLLTYVLMINSLIAMMSNTCSVVSQNRDIQYRVQQLSIVLFFESILPCRFLHNVGKPRTCKWYDSTTGQFITKKRYFMEVRSLREVTRSRSRIRPNDQTILETILTTLKSIPFPPLANAMVPKSTDSETHSPRAFETQPPLAEAQKNLDSAQVNNGIEEVDTLKPKKMKKKKKKKKSWAFPQLDALLAAGYFTHGTNGEGASHSTNRVTPDLSTNRPAMSNKMTLDINYIDTT